MNRTWRVSVLAGALLAGAVVMVWRQFGGATLTNVVALLSLLVAVATLIASAPSPARAPLDVLDRLAFTVREQWLAERGRRMLATPYPLPVGCVVRHRPYRTVGNGPPVAGTVEEAIRRFAESPGQLVVIGDPGSGKTAFAVLALLERLGRRDSDAPVPLFLQMSSWPPEETLHQWMERRLQEDYPWLATPTGHGETIAATVARRHVMPILDGLDEMAVTDRIRALATLHGTMSDSDPFVLTCRTADFDADHRRYFPTATVIELAPVEVREVARYLLDAATGDGVARWKRVTPRLVDEPHGPLAAALTNPLMLYLVRVAYQEPGRDPAELLDRSAFPDAAGIERHLIDLFVPAAFAAPDPRGSSWDPADAVRWLRFLARHLATRRSPEIAWWRLYLALPTEGATVRTVIASMLACAAGPTITFGLIGRPLFGAVFGAALGLVALAAFRVTGERRPRAFDWRLARRTRLPLAVMSFDFLVVGLSTGIAATILAGPLIGTLIAVSSATAVGLVRRSAIATEPDRAPSPMRLLRSDRAVVRYALGTGVVLGIVQSVIFLSLSTGLEPELVLKFENRAVVDSLIVVESVVVCAGGLGAIFMATSSWGKFVMARIQFARAGALPLRLMTFLEDAHRRGVLRQAGPYYEFRHAVLRDRLAVPETVDVG